MSSVVDAAALETCCPSTTSDDEPLIGCHVVATFGDEFHVVSVPERQTFSGGLTSMSAFDDLKSITGRFYRGLGDPVFLELARAVGIGPLTALVKEAVAKQPALTDETYAALENRLKTRFSPADAVVTVPDKTPMERLARLSRDLDETAVGSLELMDHTMFEFSNTLSPDVSRCTDSATADPRVAILYAYGLKTEDYFDRGGNITSYSESRRTGNTQPHVALLSHNAKTRQKTSSHFNVLLTRADGQIATEQDFLRRVERDSEVFLQSVTPVELCTLPPFDPNHPLGSLDSAASELVAKRFAV